MEEIKFIEQTIEHEDVFNNVNELAATQAQLKHQLSACLNKYLNLELQFNNNSSLKSYQAIVKQCASFQNLIDNRLELLISSTFGKHLNSVHKDIITLESKYVLIKKSMRQTDRAPTLDEHIKLLNLIEKQFGDISASIQASNNHLRSYMGPLSLINDKQVNETYASLLQLAQSSADNINTLEVEISEHLSKLCNALVSTMKEPCEHPQDTVAYYQAKQIILEQVSSHLSSILKVERPENTLVHDVSSAIKELQVNQITLSKRIDERKRIAELHKSNILSYLEYRKNKYTFKDMIFTEDRKNREFFLEDLKKELDNYAHNGNCYLLQTKITNGQLIFPGTFLKSILNRLSLALNDNEKVLPTSNENDSILMILTELRALNPLYVNQIFQLKEKITALEVYGVNLESNTQLCKVVLQLANDLNLQLNHFIRTHSQHVPNYQDLSSFRELFLLRLHSCDDLMSVHRESWKPIIANIIIALLSLGIAPAVKAAHSKVTTGRCSLFFVSTQRENLVKEIDMQTEEIASAAPAA